MGLLPPSLSLPPRLDVLALSRLSLPPWFLLSGLSSLFLWPLLALELDLLTLVVLLGLSADVSVGLRWPWDSDSAKSAWNSKYVFRKRNLEMYWYANASLLV